MCLCGGLVSSHLPRSAAGGATRPLPRNPAEVLQAQHLKLANKPRLLLSLATLGILALPARMPAGAGAAGRRRLRGRARRAGRVFSASRQS